MNNVSISYIQPVRPRLLCIKSGRCNITSASVHAAMQELVSEECAHYVDIAFFALERRPDLHISTAACYYTVTRVRILDDLEFRTYPLQLVTLQLLYMGTKQVQHIHLEHVCSTLSPQWLLLQMHCAGGRLQFGQERALRLCVRWDNES